MIQEMLCKLSALLVILIGDKLCGTLPFTIRMWSDPADIISYLQRNNATPDERQAVWKHCLRGYSFRNYGTLSGGNASVDILSCLRFSKDPSFTLGSINSQPGMTGTSHDAPFPGDITDWPQKSEIKLAVSFKQEDMHNYYSANILLYYHEEYIDTIPLSCHYRTSPEKIEQYLDRKHATLDERLCAWERYLWGRDLLYRYPYAFRRKTGEYMDYLECTRLCKELVYGTLTTQELGNLCEFDPGSIISLETRTQYLLDNLRRNIMGC